MLKLRSLVLWVVIVIGVTASVQGRTEVLDVATFRGWIETMKASNKGPFARIRWFCKDSSVLPPKPYACGSHGGGFQHGERTLHTQLLRSLGYQIANILADLEPNGIVDKPGYSDALNQIIVEQFLIAVDDGWILRKARYYRGVLQSEDESRGARRLLLGLAANNEWITKGYLPLRMAARSLPHGIVTRSVMKVRQHALALSEKDRDFMPIRYKIHIKPDRSDAARVRSYAAKINNHQLAQEYIHLAAELEKVYTPESTLQHLDSLYHKLASYREIGNVLKTGTKERLTHRDPSVRFAMTAELMAVLRDQLPKIRDPSSRLGLIDLSLALEDEHYVAAMAFTQSRLGATRQQRLKWLENSVTASYGAGLISSRERRSLKQNFATLQGGTLSLSTYKAGLDYLALVPSWGSRWLRHHFFQSIEKLATIEPLVNRFTQEQLRSSPLYPFSKLLEQLVKDVNQLTGTRHLLFEREVGAGLRALNAGLARGTLRTGSDVKNYQSDGIYLLPETTAELPPVAGILTAGEGNPLSHVQLLARNLGIPNVSIDQELFPTLKRYEGKRVILAVSPGGTIRLSDDHGQLDRLFDDRGKSAERLIRPDLSKLDLRSQDLIPLNGLRASDSGRTVGPKAAKLGELYHSYPEAVVSGVAIPFGVFRKMLDQPLEKSEQTTFQWMLSQYAMLRKMIPGSKTREAATESFLERLRAFIMHAELDSEFKQKLQIAMEEMFGKDGAYGVFVRSDTNVEDLPGFTGAGLNKTVFNVVGFDNILKAISEVWASPFTKRAFAWRQAYMDHPEHVYPAVLIMRSVPVQKSGVLVTRDIDTGDPDWLSVAVNEGIGGAVDGQSAESLRINVATGKIRLLAQATAPWRRVLEHTGGIKQLPISGNDTVLEPNEVAKLVQLAHDLAQRFPSLSNADGNPVPADIEFGFVNGNLRLFQIRPFLENKRARTDDHLASLDRQRFERHEYLVRMDARPMGGI